MQNDPFLEQEEPQERRLNFKGFGPRLGAALLDGLFMGVPIAAANFYNMVDLRSFWFWLLCAFIAMVYKPLLEGLYGATWGKMILYIQVVDYDGERISGFQAILRSIFTIGQTFITIPIYYFIFNDPILLETDGFFAFNTELAARYGFINVISGIVAMITLAEVISLLLDEPYWRSLHDRIAKTYVVEK